MLAASQAFTPTGSCKNCGGLGWVSGVPNRSESWIGTAWSESAISRPNTCSFPIVLRKRRPPTRTLVNTRQSRRRDNAVVATAPAGGRGFARRASAGRSIGRHPIHVARNRGADGFAAGQGVLLRGRDAVALRGD